jgi:hypothetical protein
VVAGWWCGPNLVRYGHPFPHLYDVDATVQASKVPFGDRRPVAWLLPFTWRAYLEQPVIHDAGNPAPNFWAATVTGTWSDWYNRGFCRLRGGASIERVWGFADTVWGGPAWRVTLRCLAVFRMLVGIGMCVTALAAFSVFACAAVHLRSGFQRASLALPVVCVLGVAALMFFAWKYPFDGEAVLNARYLLPITTPLAACLGVGLTLPASDRVRNALTAIAGLATVMVAALVVFERWGG